MNNINMNLHLLIDTLSLFEIFGNTLPARIFEIKTEMDEIIIPVLFNNNIRLNNNEWKL